MEAGNGQYEWYIVHEQRISLLQNTIADTKYVIVRILL